MAELPNWHLDLDLTITFFIFSFGVSEDMISPFMEGLSLAEALKTKKLFICDLQILDDIKISDPKERPVGNMILQHTIQLLYGRDFEPPYQFQRDPPI